MTDQKVLFCEYFLMHQNGTKSAILAGYSEKSARSKASQLLAEQEVEEYLDKRRKEISEKSLVDLTWIQLRQKEVVERCMQAEEVLIKQDGEWIPSGEWRFDSSGANKGIETLAKIIGGFEKDNGQKKTEITVTVSKEEAKEIAKSLEDEF